MFQCILDCFNDVLPLSITSMAFLNASSIPLPLSVIVIHMLILCCFCLGSGSKGGTFFCLV
jgi:hypothetical protein